MTRVAAPSTAPELQGGVSRAVTAALSSRNPSASECSAGRLSARTRLHQARSSCPVGSVIIVAKDVTTKRRTVWMLPRQPRAWISVCWMSAWAIPVSLTSLEPRPGETASSQQPKSGGYRLRLAPARRVPAPARGGRRTSCRLFRRVAVRTGTWSSRDTLRALMGVGSGKASAVWSVLQDEVVERAGARRPGAGPRPPPGRMTGFRTGSRPAWQYPGWMARRKTHRTTQPVPGDPYFPPRSPEEMLAHAKALRFRGDEDPRSRAQNYTEAAEYYAMAGDEAAAEELYRAAIDDGGFVAGSVHGFFAGFLFQRNRDEEALAIIEAARKLRGKDPDVFVVVAETLQVHGHHREAAAWATRGLVALFGSLADITAEDLEEDPDGELLATDRMRARQAAGLPADHIDDLVIAGVGDDDQSW